MSETRRSEFLRALADMKDLRRYCAAKKHFTHVDAVRINRHFAKLVDRAAELAPMFGHTLDNTERNLVPAPTFDRPQPSCAKCKKWTCHCASKQISLAQTDNNDYLKQGISSYIIKGTDSQELDWISSLRR